LVFSSVTFLFLFLPVFLVLYHLAALPSLRKTGRRSWTLSNLLILTASLLFYAWGEKLLVLIMLTSTFIDYACGLVIAGAIGRSRNRPIRTLKKGGSRTALQKTALTVSITANLGLLGLFKYFNFFVDNFNELARSIGFHGYVMEDVIRIALPVGISFYTFQSMSYTIDVFRGDTRATRNFINFSCFVTLFPQLIAGPIVRYRDLAAQLVQRTLSLEDFSSGARRFITGLGKKVLIADVLAVTADRVYALPVEQLTCGLSWLGTLCFTLQLYFDFSGYSDMAIGLGRMLGFRFPENFRYPFISQSMREYWSRWHITLGSWFRDYLFFPLGGSRRSTPRVYFNLFTVFFLCGLWHGAAWTYVCWGLFHGVFLALERTRFGDFLARLSRPTRHAYLILVNLASKVLFRSATLAQAGAVFTAMAGFGTGNGLEHNVWLCLDPETCAALVIALVGCTPFLPWLIQGTENWIAGRREGWALGLESAFSLARLAAVLVVLVCAILWTANATYVPFIYFRF
jgi:alginate O-acetyltransferase complex protein AlgI